jgi:hypothetical protein
MLGGFITEHTTFSAEDETSEHTTFSAEDDTTEHTTFSAEDETTEHTTLSIKDKPTLLPEDSTTRHDTMSHDQPYTSQQTTLSDQMSMNETVTMEDNNTPLSDQMSTIEAVTTEYNHTTSEQCTRICFQHAKWKFLDGHNMTKEQLTEFLKKELDELKRTLMIDKKSVSSSIRAKTCAYNDKDVSKSVGLMGAVIICCPFAVAIISDLTSVYINVCLKI